MESVNNMKIMIAEDDPLLLRTIVSKLRKDGHEVISCCDGQEAMEGLQEHMPDVLITDMMLPYFSGMELVSAAKQIHAREIHVIVLSAMGQEDTVKEAFAIGADDYMTKPFSFSELTIRLNKLAVR